MNGRTYFFRKIYLSYFIRERVDVGCAWEVTWRRGQTQSSSDHWCTSSSFCWAAQPWVLRVQALCLELVLTPATYLQLELQLELELPTASNWLKPSVAPGYIIVWHPPASCGHTHLHRIQPRPQIKVSSTGCTCFRCYSAYLHRWISWLTARSRVNMLQRVQSVIL